MASTSLELPPQLQRHASMDSSEPSLPTSPGQSPRQSPSNTSISSLEERPTTGKLLDTYGNEFQLPDFTVKQIRDAIPRECFERNGLLGLGYVARDLFMLGAIFYVFHNYVTPETVPSKPARAVLWGLYTFLQGLFGTGIWVLAHECGHQAFSPSKAYNDTVGWVLHSMLLVPYFSWKISHGKHHKATGNIARDMVFLPKTREQYSSKLGRASHELSELMEETPIATVASILTQQLFGWWVYLATNVTGHNNHESQREGRGKGKSNGWLGGVNHFNPSSPLYESRDSKWIIVSDLGLLLMGTIIYALTQKFGRASMFVWYWIPYFWVNHWLVAITYLQHTDPTLPHYKPESWNFARGAAATIDRDFGFIGKHVFHDIIETHVLHHYVCTIPFYNARLASDSIKPVMGPHYRSDTKGGPWGFLRSLWTASRHCQWVEPSEGAVGEGKGVLFYRNRNKFGVPPQKIPSEFS